MSHLTGDALLNYLTPFWDGAWGAIKLSSVLMAFFLLMEILRPGRALHWKNIAFNAIYAPLYLTFAMALLYPISSFLAPYAEHTLISFPQPGQSMYTLRLVVTAAIYLFIFDFLYYWFHRAQHQFSAMWRMHMFHHSDVNVSMLTSVRHHWSEEAIRYFFMALPLSLIFGGAKNIPFWLQAFTGLAGLYVHWNMPWRLPALTNWIVTPWYHRIHHSIERKHYNKNFAVMFPIWDILFKTIHRPGKNEFPETGVENISSPNSPLLLSPWPRSPDEPRQPQNASTA